MALWRGLTAYFPALARIGERTTAPDDGARGGERQGIASVQRPDGPLIWVHSDDGDGLGWLSVLARSLEAERGEDVTLLLTTDRAEDAPWPALHQLVPNEAQRAIDEFLNHWRPDMALCVDVPKRPALLSNVAGRGIPLILAGRRKPKSERPPSGRLLDHFDRILATSATDATTYHRLGIPPDTVDVTGPLSDLGTPLPCDTALQARIHDHMAGRPLWLAASVTADETEAVETAHRDAQRFSHRLLLILVPRDGETDGLAKALASRGWRATAQGKSAPVDEVTEIVVADPDALGLWYRISPMSFVGGSLFDAGSADPFAPALLGSAVLHGVHHAPFETRYQRLREAGATVELGGPETFPSALRILFSPDRAAEVAHSGWSVTSEAAPVVERIAAMANAVLDGEGLD